MSKKLITIGVTLFVALIVTIMGFSGLVGKNDDQNWQVLQSVSGNITIVDSAGYYPKWFGTVTTYPRASGEEFNGDESVRTTFNDGGTAQVSTMVRYQTPTKEGDRKKFHRDFAGNMENAEIALRAHLTNCIKATGPLMSSTENQTSRKSEFNGVIQDQLRSGLYRMRQVKIDSKDKFDEKGKAITVYATQIITSTSGKPIIVEASPLQEYGIQVLQYSTTKTDYDPETRKQFAAKKESYQLAEKSKAQREQEVQQRLMVIEKGLREKEEVTSSANVAKAAAVIQAEQEKEVAELNADREKQVAETSAAKLLAVATLEKETAEMAAAQLLSVAKLGREAATENAAAIVILAEAEQEKIELAGAISEETLVLAKIAADRDVKIAGHLAQLKTPSVILNGGGQGSDGGGMTENLLNLRLLEASGLLNKVQTRSASQVHSSAQATQVSQVE